MVIDPGDQLGRPAVRQRDPADDVELRRPDRPVPPMAGTAEVGAVVSCSLSSIHNTITRLRVHGAELFGEVAQYEDIFLLCNLRGLASIIVVLAEQTG